MVDHAEEVEYGVYREYIMVLSKIIFYLLQDGYRRLLHYLGAGVVLLDLDGGRPQISNSAWQGGVLLKC